MLATTFVTGFIHASRGKIQGLLKTSPIVFKDLQLMNNTDLSVSSTSEMLDRDNGDISTGNHKA